MLPEGIPCGANKHIESKSIWKVALWWWLQTEIAQFLLINKWRENGRQSDIKAKRVKV